MNIAESVKSQATELINKMINTSEIEVVQEENMYHINIKTEEEAPTVIGRHGETIRANQKILEVILYKQTGENVDILVNVNDYREKQQERLQHIASEVASKTEYSQAPSYLRGFSSYERRIMHEYITNNYPELTTYSVGEGRDRRLVVDLKTNQQEQQEA